MRPSPAILASLLAAAVLTGCDTTDACPQYEAPGLVLEVRDSVTGAGLAPSALIIASESGSAGADTMRWIPNADSAIVIGLAGRSGSFALSVTVPGYQPWQDAALMIHENACSQPVTVETTALMQLP